MTDSSYAPTRGAALAVLCTVALMIVLDSTIVAVAVPTIQVELGFSAAGIAWVVNGYLLGFAGLLLLAGRLGDLVGARRVFLIGVVVFTAASLLCGLASTPGLLILGRFVQGIGGALAAAVIFGLIVRLYPEPGAQARAIGVYSFVQAGGAAIGFVAGGVLTEVVGWPSIFLVNVPIGVAVLIAALRVVPHETSPGLRGGVDVSGAVLVTVGLSLGVYAIVRGGEATAQTAQILAYGGISVLLLIGFLIRQRYAAAPLVPLRVLRRRWLLGANGAVMLIFATGMGFQFVCALFLQRVMGFDALGTGLGFLPTPLVIGVISLVVAPRVTARFGARRVLLVGLALLGAGILLFSRVPVDARYLVDVLPPLVIMGFGVGVVFPAVIMLAMADAPAGETGLVSGLANTAQQAGAAVGLSVLAVVAARVTGGDGGQVGALRDGYSAAFLVAVGFVVAAFLIVAVVLRRPATPSRDRDGVVNTGGDGAAAGGGAAASSTASRPR